MSFHPVNKTTSLKGFHCIYLNLLNIIRKEMKGLKLNVLIGSI